MRRNLNAVYVLHSITGLASSIIGIFIPAYLISLGYAPAYVFWYYLIYAISIFIFFFCAALFAGRLGVRIMIIASFPFTLTYIGLLYMLHTMPLPLSLIASVQGAGAGLYWFALHSFFATHTKEETLGASVGKLFGFPQIVGLFGPLVGGIIAFRYGFPVLLAFGGCIFLVSSIPLLWIPELTTKSHLNFATFIGLFRQFRRYTLVEFFENIREELEAIVWPLFIFLVFRNALSVGFVGTLAAIGSIIFTLVVGRYTDKINPKIFMRTGAVLMIGLWLSRFVWSNVPMLLYASTVVAGLLACLIEVPFVSYVYSAAKRTNITEFIVYRGFPVTLARIVIYGTALLIVTNITNLFLVGAVASAFVLLF
jgi:MFS family permease